MVKDEKQKKILDRTDKKLTVRVMAKNSLPAPCWKIEEGICAKLTKNGGDFWEP